MTGPIIKNSKLKMQRFSAVEEFGVGLPHFGEPEAVDELDDVVERGFDHPTAAADGGEGEQRALPQVLVAAPRGGDVELIGHPRLDALQPPPFSFEGVVLGQNQVELEHPDDDGGGVGRGILSSYRLSPAEARPSRPPGAGVMRRMTAIFS